MFIEKYNSLFSLLGEHQIMVLATSKDNRVTARSMSFIILNQKLYFQTDKAFLKYEQITFNNKVAICYNNIQIEGTCLELGHPLDHKNIAFINKYRLFFKSSYEKYSHMQNETVFIIQPKYITIWNYEGTKPFREYFDVDNKVYKKDYYDNAI